MQILQKKKNEIYRKSAQFTEIVNNLQKKSKFYRKNVNFTKLQNSQEKCKIYTEKKMCSKLNVKCLYGPNMLL